MRIERSARLFVLLCLVSIGSLAAPAQAHATEACTGAPSAFLLLDPGDEDSGVGGTGRGPATARRDRSGDDDDSGTGGTGQAPRPPDDGDSGIGGTGIFGTVSRSDRLCVNGFPIEVPESLTLEASTGAASENRLAAGQVVFVQATRSEDGLVAQRIVLIDGHAGQVEVFDPGQRQLIVSGRRVRLAEGLAWGDGLGLDTLEAGQWISVHGLIDPDRVLVASRIEAGRAGEIRRLEDGARDGAEHWLAQAGPLEYVSLEGFLAGTSARPRLAGFELELGRAVPDALRERVQPGARVRAGGRIDAAGSLRVLQPPRPSSPRDTPALRPDARPGGEPDPTNAVDSPTRPDRPDAQETPRPTRRPRNDLPPRPDAVRPEIRRPVKRPAAINRPTRDVRPTR